MLKEEDDRNKRALRTKKSLGWGFESVAQEAKAKLENRQRLTAGWLVGWLIVFYFFFTYTCCLPFMIYPTHPPQEVWPGSNLSRKDWVSPNQTPVWSPIPPECSEVTTQPEDLIHIKVLISKPGDKLLVGILSRCLAPSSRGANP